MNVTRYEPYGVFQRVHSDLNRLFGDYFTDATPSVTRAKATTNWSPAVYIKEEDDRYVIIADVPGVPLENIDITVDDGVLTVKGTRDWADSEEKDGFKRVERARGTFTRRFSLPDNANQETVEASGKDGVLQVVIPKQEKAQPRRIPIVS